MQSFVRSLLSSPSGDSAVLGEVVADASERWARSPASLRAEPRYAGGMFRAAMLRRALSSLGQQGELPLVLSLECWLDAATEGASTSGAEPVTVLHSAGRHRSLVDALERAGWTVQRGRDMTRLSLRGVPSEVLLCERLSEDGLFALDLRRVRARAVIDEHAAGALAARPSAEDGLSVWVSQQGRELMRGRRPQSALARRWHARFPSEPERLERALRQHGLLRLGRLMLRAAAENAPAGGSLAPLIDDSLFQPLAGALARAAWSAPAAGGLLGSAAAYALDDDPKRAARALAQRAQRAWARGRTGIGQAVPVATQRSATGRR